MPGIILLIIYADGVSLSSLRQTLSVTHKLSASVAHELSYLWFPVKRGGSHETDRDTTGGQEDEI